MEKYVERAITNLKRHGFDVRYVESKAEANEVIDSFIRPGAVVGFGGSMTIKELGTAEFLQPKAIEVVDHNQAHLSAEEKHALRKRELVSDVFLTSSNAVTETGELLNVDGAGNRVAAMMFGPDKVIVVCGVNKIVPDLDAAYARVRETAAPLNNVRLSTGNPCTKLTPPRCVDCQGEGRICRVISVMERRPLATDMTIVLVNEQLGY